MDKYQLVKVTLESGRGGLLGHHITLSYTWNISVTESVLNNDDIPWEVLKRRGFESVRLMELTRFYLQLKEDPHGPNVALFVGNLPPNLNEKQYETILLDYLDDGTPLFTFLPHQCQILATISLIFSEEFRNFSWG